MLMRKPDQRPLTPDDWARTALGAIARGGVDAVAVESVATELGATKGSFYWHFKKPGCPGTGGSGQVGAAADRGRHRRAGARARPGQTAEEADRSRLERGPADRAEIALLANPDHPAALQAVRRVTERRIRYMAEQLEKLGWDPDGAFNRAILLYYVYVGYLQTAHVAPNMISDDARRRHLELMFDSLIATEPLKLPHGPQPT